MLIHKLLFLSLLGLVLASSSSPSSPFHTSSSTSFYASSPSPTSPSFQTGFSNDLATALELFISQIESAIAIFEPYIYSYESSISTLFRQILESYGISFSQSLAQFRHLLRTPDVATTFAIVVESALIRAGYQSYIIAFDFSKNFYYLGRWTFNNPLLAKRILFDIGPIFITLIRNIVPAILTADVKSIVSSIYVFLSNVSSLLHTFGTDFDLITFLTSIMGLIAQIILLKKRQYNKFLGMRLLKCLFGNLGQQYPFLQWLKMLKEYGKVGNNI